MELLEFYRALLPGSGRYALFSVPRKTHLWADSLEQLVALTNKVNKEHSWYYATAAFAAGVKERKQTHVVAKRCFYFDIDAGAEKHARDPHGTYPDQKAAKEAVFSFARDTGLIPSLVVSSGAGLHVYFALDEDVEPAAWTAVSTNLGTLARARGLRVDSACTTDSARVLRPVGALHKNGARVEVVARTSKVWSLEELRNLVGVAVPEDVPVRRDRARLDVNAGLTLWEPSPASAWKAAEKCAALRDIAEVRGDVPEPQWRAMLGVVKFSVEGADLAHQWSAGYDGYSFDETQRKFDRYEGTGPTRCSSFERFSERCKTCEFRGKISSPLSLGRLTDKQVESLPEEQRPAPKANTVPTELPIPVRDLGRDFRITRLESGRYVLEYKKAIVNGEGDEKTTLFRWARLSDDVFWLEGWTEAGHTGDDGALVTLKLWRDGRIQSFEWQTKAFASRRDTLEFLFDRGISCAGVDPATMHMMHKYVAEQFRNAKLAASRPVVRTRFGLQFDSDAPNAKLICAQGKYVIKADGVIEEAILGSKLVPHRNMFGIACLPPSANGRWPNAAEVWKNHIAPAAKKQIQFYRDYYTKPGYEVAQLAIMLSLASPLLVFAAGGALVPGEQLPAVGLTVSLYSSNSGKGKTSMQKAAAAAYGNPAGLVLSGAKEDATPVAQAALAAMMGTLPYFLDEVTGNGPAEVGGLINRIASGSDRRRADRKGNPREANTWALIGSVSTNIPQREMLTAYQKSSDALQMRLLELTCEFPDLDKSQHTEYERRFAEEMVANAGALGAVINLAVLQAGQAQMQARLQKAYEEAAKRIVGATQRQRFFQRGMACVLAAHDLLAAVGMAPFDREVLLVQYEAAAKSAMDYSAMVSKDPVDLLRKMVSDLAPNIIVTQNEFHGGHDRQLDSVLNERSLKTPYVGRRIAGLKRLYILSDAMKQWARENQVSYGEIVRAAELKGLLRPVSKYGLAARYTLTKGTTLSSVNGMAYCIDEGPLFEEDSDEVPANVVELKRPARPLDPAAPRPADRDQGGEK